MKRGRLVILPDLDHDRLRMSDLLVTPIERRSQIGRRELVHPQITASAFEIRACWFYRDSSIHNLVSSLLQTENVFYLDLSSLTPACLAVLHVRSDTHVP